MRHTSGGDRVQLSQGEQSNYNPKQMDAASMLQMGEE